MLFKKFKINLKNFGIFLGELFMPGENEDYGSSQSSNMSTMSIVLGSTLIVAGVPLTVFPVTMPLGATFLTMGGIALSGGSAVKIGKKIMKNKKENKRKESDIRKETNAIVMKIHEAVGNTNESKEECDTKLEQPKIADFKSKKSSIRYFDKKQNINENKKALLKENKRVGK